MARRSDPVFCWRIRHHCTRQRHRSQPRVLPVTKDLARPRGASQRVEPGMVHINSGIISDVVAPLGGYEASGIGPERGILGIEVFLATKYTFIPTCNCEMGTETRPWSYNEREWFENTCDLRACRRRHWPRSDACCPGCAGLGVRRQ
ncbi:aldehyde dehydrogenase family protein [Pseudoclavibacter terrae]|uniref:Aldehyde dehydrogenase family protein n=1 Tax=Pseudoclavibacter terrae TaxID=1530195 RepID=A0A7J5AXE7_9MICO|nr:aldehyde dehydrogenase family protein [Pseudoclavibacter terrae]